MKILLTGMTSPHVSRVTNNRTFSFAGQLAETLGLGGSEVEVVWKSVGVDEVDSTDDYDYIIVGLTPFTALGALHSYGALALINKLYDDPRLRLFVDAPNPAQITHSLQAILKTPNNMLKDFYRNRYGYGAANDPETRLGIYTAIRRLALDIWPTTIYPRLPWDQEDLEFQLPEGALGRVHPVNLDAVSLRHKKPHSLPTEDHWVTDDLKSKWIKEVAETLASPVAHVKRNKFSSDFEVDQELAAAIGFLASPAKRGRTWWTHRIPQALRLGVPVVTEWRDSGVLGSEWQVLASQLEHMSDDRRAELARDQLLSYSTAVGTPARAREDLLRALDIEDKNE